MIEPVGHIRDARLKVVVALAVPTLNIDIEIFSSNEYTGD